MRTRIAIATALVLALTTIQSPIASSATRPKAAGRTTASVANTILNGKGAPSSTKGIDGDFYIDTKNLTLYGPKTNGRWSSPQSLQGPQGESGTDGKNGSDGKATVSSSGGGSIGPAGPAGPQGETGPAGPQGPAGSSGSGGGSQGPAGADGATGPAGPKGETGTAGSIGPSRISTGSLTYADISGGIGSSTYSSITGFKAGKSYVVRLLINSYTPSKATDSSMPLGFNVSATGGSPVIWTTYSVFKGNTFRTGAGSSRFEYSVVAEVTLDGSSTTDFGIDVYVIAGLSTVTDLLKVQGAYTATLVGSIGGIE